MGMIRTVIGFASLATVAGAAWAGSLLSVDQRGLTFSMPQLTVRKGDVVSFTNSDNTSHNILVSGNGISLNSGLQRPGVAFNAPFLKNGTYQVTCGIHPRMKMTVVVR